MKILRSLWRVCALIVKLLAVCTVYTSGSAGGSYQNTRMVRASHCPGQVNSWTHRYRTLGARSLLECVSNCGPDVRCLAIVFDASNKTCYLSNTTASADCSNMIAVSEKWKHYETTLQPISCENGGVVNPDGASCTCPDGYYGNTCEDTMPDCEAFLQSGILSTKAVLFVKPALAPAPFPVFCDYLPPSGLLRTRILQRIDEAASFNRSWQEYRDGFGSPGSSSHWLGLERIHLLTTSRKYEVRFRVTLANETSFFQYYQDFVVGDEAGGYAISFNGAVVNMDLGDCLGNLQGARFSTYDVDNDESASVHCAQQHGGGWWFKGDTCSSCNPLGPIIPLLDGRRKGVSGESFWTNKLGDLIPFSFKIFLVAAP